MRSQVVASILLFVGLLFLPIGAPAQHATAVTSIVNSDSDTTLEVNHNGSLVAPGTYVTDGSANDSIPATGAGTRMMWYPAKAAFRVGRVGVSSGKGDVWDADSVGFKSVAFGQDTKASNIKATAMGDGTTASGRRSTAMGSHTTASNFAATAMGDNTVASGNNTTAMGRRTTAASENSVAIGQCNSANTEKDSTLFVAGRGSDPFLGCDSRSDALVLTRSAELAIGHSSPVAGLHVEESVRESGATNLGRHVAAFENTKAQDGADILGLKSHANDPGEFTNFISFIDADEAVGSIEGDGNGGITLTSGSADFAEELPLAEGTPTPDPADLVGVHGGTVRLETSRADHVMIASTAPIMTGNATPSTEADDARRVAVAFVGQVPAKVRGPVHIGELIVASGKNDGTGRAVSHAEYRREAHGPIAGQAWSPKASEGLGEVTVAVGLGRGGAVAERLQRQRRRIADLEAENEQIKNRLAALEAKMSRNARALAGLAGPWSLGPLLVLTLGGLFGAVLWHRTERPR